MEPASKRLRAVAWVKGNDKCCHIIGVHRIVKKAFKIIFPLKTDHHLHRKTLLLYVFTTCPGTLS